MNKEVCGLRRFESYEGGMGITYTCDLPKDHEGRHRNRLSVTDTFSWPRYPETIKLEVPDEQVNT